MAAYHRHRSGLWLPNQAPPPNIALELDPTGPLGSLPSGSLAWVAGGGTRAVTGQIGTLPSGYGFRTGALGPAYFGSSSSLAPLTFPATTTLSAFTIFAVFDFSTGAGSAFTTSVAGGGATIRYQASNQDLYLDIYNGSSLTVINSIVAGTYAVAATWDGTHTNAVATRIDVPTLYAPASGTSAAPGTGGGTCGIGGCWGSFYSPGGVYAAAFAPNYVAPLSGLINAVQNPFSFVRAAARRTYSIPAAPGGALSGSAAVVTTASGTLTGTGALSGSGSSATASSGTLSGSGALAGSSASTTSAGGTLSASAGLSGLAGATSAAAVTLTGSGALAGSASATTTSAAALTGAGPLGGAGASVTAAAGTLAGKGALAGAAAAVSSASAALTGRGALSGAANAVSVATVALTAPGGLTGSGASASSASGALTGRGDLLASAASVTVAAGTLTSASSGALTGSAAAVSTASCVLTSGPLTPTSPTTTDTTPPPAAPGAAPSGQPIGPAVSDDVSIVVGGQTIGGWENVAIWRGIERMPASFDIGLTERYPTQDGLVDIRPGQPIQVKIGSDKILTGYVDHYNPGLSANSHGVQIAGRSMSEDLVDCSAKFSTFQINNTTMMGLANTLCQPFEVAVMTPDGDSGVLPQFSVILTETPYEIMERVCRWANFLLYDDVSGAIILGRVGDKTMASGFSEGVNIQDVQAQFSTSERYTEIDPVYLSTAFLQLAPDANGAPQLPYIPGAAATDSTFPPRASGTPRYRPLIVVSEQSQAAPNLAKLRAQWEMTRRAGRSQAVTVTCDSWRDSAGTLWTPNALAPLNIPSAKLPNRTWLISDVGFLRNENGTTAQVTLMPKEAFIPAPDVLLPFDWQVSQELAGGGAANYAPAPRGLQ